MRATKIRFKTEETRRNEIRQESANTRNEPLLTGRVLCTVAARMDLPAG
jgi:hypothetical protein